MNSQSDQRVRLTKKLIRESLLEMMKKTDISDISVRALCDAAGVHRSTFYNHYGCPMDVLNEIENEILMDLEQLWKDKFPDGSGTMNCRIEELCLYIQTRRDLFLLLFRSTDISTGFPAKLMNSAFVHSTYLKMVGHHEDREAEELLSSFLSNGAYGLIRQWLLSDMKKSPEEIGRLVYEISRKGWNQ